MDTNASTSPDFGTLWMETVFCNTDRGNITAADRVAGIDSLMGDLRSHTRSLPYTVDVARIVGVLSQFVPIMMSDTLIQDLWGDSGRFDPQVHQPGTNTAEIGVIINSVLEGVHDQTIPALKVLFGGDAVDAALLVVHEHKVVSTSRARQLPVPDRSGSHG